MQIKTAEIITIGDEIMIGQITDTNTQFISTELNKLGIKVVRKSSVGDDKNEITQILNEAFSRADLIITTGGLGPTKDDITKHTLCEYFNAKLVIHEPTLVLLKDFFEKRFKELTEINRNQALVPDNCIVLENKNGTAPCMWFEHKQKILVSLPGVPFEMKALMQDQVYNKIKTLVGSQEIYHKTILTAGIGESAIASLIENWEDKLPSHIKLAYLPAYGSVRLRLSAYGTDISQLEKETNELFREIYPTLEKNIVSTETDSLEVAIGLALKAKNLTLATAESCTGGAIASALVKVPGSSAYFKGGIVAYCNEVKKNILKVKEETLTKFGAVSEECVIEMAQNSLHELNALISVAVSGIAGPDGGTDEKPVGTIWLAVSNGTKTTTKKLTGTHLREANINYAITQSLFLVLEFIRKNHS